MQAPSTLMPAHRTPLGAPSAAGGAIRQGQTGDETGNAICGARYAL